MDVHLSCDKNTERHLRETGSLEFLQPKTGLPPKLESHQDLLQHFVAETPDATLEEIREQLPVPVCLQTVANALIPLKLLYKKTTESVGAKSSGHRSKTSTVKSDAVWFEPEKTCPRLVRIRCDCDRPICVRIKKSNRAGYVTKKAKTGMERNDRKTRQIANLSTGWVKIGLPNPVYW